MHHHCEVILNAVGTLLNHLALIPNSDASSNTGLTNKWLQNYK